MKNLGNARSVLAFAVGIVTVTEMDAFLRLAKGLSPSNANREAEKVFRISDYGRLL